MASLSVSPSARAMSSISSSVIITELYAMHTPVVEIKTRPRGQKDSDGESSLWYK